MIQLAEVASWNNPQNRKARMKTKSELETLEEMRISGALMLTDMHGQEHCYPIINGRAVSRFGAIDRSILETNDTAIFIR